MAKHKANEKGSTRTGLRSATSASNETQMTTRTAAATTTKPQPQPQNQNQRAKVSKFLRAAQLLTVSRLDPVPEWAGPLTRDDIALASRWVAILHAGHVDPLASASDDATTWPPNWQSIRKSLPAQLGKLRSDEWIRDLEGYEARWITKKTTGATATAIPTSPTATRAATPPPSPPHHHHYHSSASASTSTLPTAKQTAKQTNKKTAAAVESPPMPLAPDLAPSTDKHDTIFATTRDTGTGTNTGGAGKNTGPGLMSHPSTEQRQVRDTAKGKGGSKGEDKDRYEGGGGGGAGTANADAAALHHRDKQRLTRLFRDLHRRRRLEQEHKQKQ